MSEQRKVLGEALAEYDALSRQLHREVYPEDGSVSARSTALLDKDKHCKVLLKQLASVEETVEKKFSNAILTCTPSEATASSSSIMTSQARTIQKDLLAAQQCIEQAIFNAKKQMEAVQQAERGSIPADNLIKFAHRISQANAVAAPVGWGPGDPRRPYPSDFEMRIGSLGSLGAPSPAVTGAGEVPAVQAMEADNGTAVSKAGGDNLLPNGESHAGTVSSLATGLASTSSAPMAVWQPPQGIGSDDDVSSDSSDSSSAPRSHGPAAAAHQTLNLPVVCNGSDGNQAPSSASSSSHGQADSNTGRLSADTSSSSSSSDDEL